MTEAELAEIEARASKATAGPWDAVEEDRHVYIDAICSDLPRGKRTIAETFCHITKADAAFVAHAREDVPALIAALRAAWAERDEALRRLKVAGDLVADLMVERNDARAEREHARALEAVAKAARAMRACQKAPRYAVEEAVMLGLVLDTALAALDQST